MNKLEKIVKAVVSRLVDGRCVLTLKNSGRQLEVVYVFDKMQGKSYWVVFDLTEEETCGRPIEYDMELAVYILQKSADHEM